MSVPPATVRRPPGARHRTLAPALAPALALALSPALSACNQRSSPPTARSCTVTPPAPADWRLHADGTKLRDGLGRVVFLRGVDAGGRSKWAPYVPFEYAQGQYAPALAAYMDRAASWGIDAMRVPFTWAALEPTKGTYDQDWLSRYEQLLDAAWARGIWTVVDFHQDVYSEAFCGDGFPAWTLSGTPAMHACPSPSWPLEYTSDADVRAAFDRFWAAGSPLQTAYLAAWNQIIGATANRPGVLGFEPINEPGWGTEDEATFEAKTLSPFYFQIGREFVNLAPTSLVFFDAPGIDALTVTTELVNPDLPGAVFAPHYYPPGLPGDAQILSDLGKWAAVGAAWNAPVFVGEFGVSHDNESAVDLMTSEFAALDQLGLGGTEWEYSVESTEWNDETDSVVAADGTEYPVAQVLVRPFARAVAGDAIAQAWDATSATFTLSYAPSVSQGAAGGVTEVQLPTRAFPHGYQVKLDGACYDATSAPGRLLLQADAEAEAGADGGDAQVKLTLTSR